MGEPIDRGRRQLLTVATTLTGAVGVAFAAVPFLSSWKPSARAKALGAKRAILLTVSAPFHCALMKPAEVRLTPELHAVPAADPRVPVVANVDAEPKRTAAASIDALIKQIASPVRWEGVVQRLASEGVTRYVEVGPGKVLTGLAKKIAPGATLLNVEGPDDLPALEALFSAA